MWRLKCCAGNELRLRMRENIRSIRIRFCSEKRNLWKELLFHSKTEQKESSPYTEDNLMKKMGRFKIEKAFSRSMSLPCCFESRRLQIGNQTSNLSMHHQLKLFQKAHSDFYSKSRRKIFRTASDERGKNEMMKIYMKTPFYGVHRLSAELKCYADKVNHKRVCRFQKLLNLQTVYPRPHFNNATSAPVGRFLLLTE